MINTAEKNTKKTFVTAVGRNREAVARVRLYLGDSFSWKENEVKKGDIFINQKPIDTYFYGEVAKALYMRPFHVTNTIGKYPVTIQAVGGGKRGQVKAVVLGLARALDILDGEKYHPLLKKHGLLTRDPRARERRNVGMGGKSRRKKQSPKR